MLLRPDKRIERHRSELLDNHRHRLRAGGRLVGLQTRRSAAAVLFLVAAGVGVHRLSEAQTTAESAEKQDQTEQYRSSLPHVI